MGMKELGVTGFEPATSWSQTRRSGQTELHPETHLLSGKERILIYPFAKLQEKRYDSHISANQRMSSRPAPVLTRAGDGHWKGDE